MFARRDNHQTAAGQRPKRQVTISNCPMGHILARIGNLPANMALVGFHGVLKPQSFLLRLCDGQGKVDPALTGVICPIQALSEVLLALHVS